MAKYKKRRGDRKDGRLLRSLPAFSTFIPYIMPQRNDATVYYKHSFEITKADKYLRKLRVDGYKGIGFVHYLIAAYIRCVSVLPGLNRFVVGRRIYAHDDIEIVMAVKRSLSIDSTETTIKIKFAPTDTIFDVYRKLNEEIEKVRISDEGNDTDDFAETFSKLPRPILKFAIWVLKVMDYYGLIPQSWLDLSPFHGSLIITDLGSLRIDPVYHHIYNFGTLPFFIAFGAKRHSYELDRKGNVVEKKLVDCKFSLDERIVDGYYFSKFLQAFNYMFEHPELLETSPSKVIEDVY